MARIFLITLLVAVVATRSLALPVKTVSDSKSETAPAEDASVMVMASDPQKPEDPQVQEESQIQEQVKPPAQEEQEDELQKKAAEEQPADPQQQQQQEDQIEEKASPPKEQQSIKQRKVVVNHGDLFVKHDSDVDGFIDEVEFKGAYDFPGDVLKKAFSSADSDENLKLDKEEFAKVSFDEAEESKTVVEEVKAPEEAKEDKVQEEQEQQPKKEEEDVKSEEKQQEPSPSSEDKEPEEKIPEANLKSEGDLEKPQVEALEEDEKKPQEIAQPQEEKKEEQIAPEKAEEQEKPIETSDKEAEQQEARSVDDVPSIEEIAPEQQDKPVEVKKQEEQAEDEKKIEEQPAEEILAIVEDESQKPEIPVAVIVPENTVEEVEQPSEREEPVVLVPEQPVVLIPEQPEFVKSEEGEQEVAKPEILPEPEVTDVQADPAKVQPDEVPAIEEASKEIVDSEEIKKIEPSVDA